MVIPMQEDNLHVNVLAVLVQEVLEEVWDWFVGDVATHDNMSANTTNELNSTPGLGKINRETYKQLPYTRSM